MQKLSGLEKPFVPADLSVDEQRKRRFLALFLLFLTPALFLVGLFNLWSHRSNAADLILWLGTAFGVLVLPEFRGLTRNGQRA